MDISIFLSIVLPWLYPFSPGPTPVISSLIFSWACIAITLIYAGGQHESMRIFTVIAAAWLLTALLSALFGLLQYFGATALFEPWINRASLGDAYANLRQRNQFATLANMGLVSLLWWTATSAISNKPKWILATMGASLLLVVGNAASSSRTGLVQLVMLIAIAWFWSRQSYGGVRTRIRRVLLVSVFAYGMGLLLLPRLAGLNPEAVGVLARIHQSDADCSSRLTLWSNVLHLIAQKPWFGWGWGELDYAHFITLYPGDRFCDILDNAHNLPLHFAVELGVPFAATFCALCLWFVWRSKPWRETDATRQMAWSVLALIGLHSLLEYPLWYGPFQIAVGLCLFLLWRTPVVTLANGNIHKPFRYPASVPIAWAAILIIAICTYAAWDYWRISQIYLPPSLRANAYRDNTLEKVQGTWLYKSQVRFAELTVTPMTPDNAAHLNALAKDLLHFSPEARVVQALVDSAVMLGRDDEALYYSQRFKAAFPAVHARESQ